MTFVMFFYLCPYYILLRMAARTYPLQKPWVFRLLLLNDNELTLPTIYVRTSSIMHILNNAPSYVNLYLSPTTWRSRLDSWRSVTWCTFKMLVIAIIPTKYHFVTWSFPPRSNVGLCVSVSVLNALQIFEHFALITLRDLIVHWAVI